MSAHGAAECSVCEQTAHVEPASLRATPYRCRRGDVRVGRRRASVKGSALSPYTSQLKLAILTCTVEAPGRIEIALTCGRRLVVEKWGCFSSAGAGACSDGVPSPRRAGVVATGHTYMRRALRVCRCRCKCRCARRQRDLSCFAFVDAAANYGQGACLFTKRLQWGAAFVDVLLFGCAGCRRSNLPADTRAIGHSFIQV